ncbi:hypothetical protein [Amycolatopsis taiwanensis]|uniref:Uncharacterized protein n=1 Tax=Amycolatopsis taiwanensis TaxID=342230 RepID=A0A9W6R811_9PSEU|nr:hypothetical protein [Amycolatopsis taiwanensis]GLY70968.1 hypothetical protein Atai01_75870 [Amycolatopsis taiwanensis]
MSKFLHTGWHEFLLPVLSCRETTEYLRVWLDMAAVVPMLRELDLAYGDREHPYALDPRQIPQAQAGLLAKVAQHLLDHPGALRRAAASRAFATELADRFAVSPAAGALPYPPFIDQVDLEPHQVEMALPLIIDRALFQAPTADGPAGEGAP